MARGKEKDKPSRACSNRWSRCLTPAMSSYLSACSASLAFSTTSDMFMGGDDSLMMKDERAGRRDAGVVYIGRRGSATAHVHEFCPYAQWRNVYVKKRHPLATLRILPCTFSVRSLPHTTPRFPLSVSELETSWVFVSQVSKDVGRVASGTSQDGWERRAVRRHGRGELVVAYVCGVNVRITGRRSYESTSQRTA